MIGLDEFGIQIEQYKGELQDNIIGEYKDEVALLQAVRDKVKDLKQQIITNPLKRKELEKEIKETYKNSIVKSLINGISYLNNATSAQYPVNNEEASSLKEQGDKMKDYQTSNIQHGSSMLAVSTQKVANMTGKDATGIGATGLKAFSAMYYYHLSNPKYKNKPFVFNGVERNIQVSGNVSNNPKDWENFSTFTDELIREYGDKKLSKEELELALLKYNNTDRTLSGILQMAVDSLTN